MIYNVNFNAWNGAVAVPRSLIEKHLRLAGALQLKAALWVFASGKGTFTAEEVAAALNMKTADVADALQYWEAEGYFTREGEAVKSDCFKVEVKETKTNTKQVNKEEKKPARQRLPKPDTRTVTDRINECHDIRCVVEEAQRILGTTISPALTSTLVAMYDDYGLPADVIVMLLGYTKSVGKANTRYIEAVGKEWSESEIDTSEKAAARLEQLNEINRAWRKLTNALDIAYRSPSARETEYVERWILNWKFSIEMIREAYERCVDNTGKCSFGYMNKVLERWNRENIKSPEQAKESDDKRRTSKKDGVTFNTDELDSFDLDT